MSTIKDGTTALATYSYDNLGNRTSATLGNGVIQSYAYDPVSRLTTLTNSLAGTTNDLTIGGSTTPITYNAASQILTAPRSNSLYSWTGAAAVNRAYGINGLNQYTSAGTATFGYDAKGNLTSDGTNAFGYSSENLLTSAPGTTLAYDPLMRLYQVAGTTTTRFAYDGLNMLADYDGANTLQHRYVFGPGTDEPIVEYSSTGVRTFLSADERGSVIARTDSSGALAAANQYDEYGIPQTDATGHSQNTGLFQYTGQAWISQLGMYYYKARIYSPRLGRFMQTDPIGAADNANLYAYVRNDPVNLIDSFGLDATTVPRNTNCEDGNDQENCPPIDVTAPAPFAMASVNIVSGPLTFSGLGFGGLGSASVSAPAKQQQKQNQCSTVAQGLQNAANFFKTLGYGEAGIGLVTAFVPGTQEVAPEAFAGAVGAFRVAAALGALSNSVKFFTGAPVAAINQAISNAIDAAVPGEGALTDSFKSFADDKAEEYVDKAIHGGC